MKSEAKTLLTTPTEQPHHYTYLKEFRVQQCPLFLQHKCTQHRPYTCFDWHFMNQRRRRPVRKRDGSFNYSADNYCTKFDETTGLCPEGDDCPYLHRTAGDTERRYHLRYYKTGMCVHDTDSRGLCVKNGAHCAFSHGTQDLRPPVYDIKEMQALENPDFDANALSNGPNVLDKERNLMNEDPKWQDTSYVLANYKTEPCKRPPRLCRQGYACPQYHNSRDKRRNPRKIKYRSTPCPSVKHGDEWGEPAQCENGDACQYCHTRTEQQFHPEIYKSTKCHDVQTARYCPRGVFCAFAHVEHEMAAARDMAACSDSGTNLAEILSTALAPTTGGEKHGGTVSGSVNSGTSAANATGNNNAGSSSGAGVSGNSTGGVIGSGIGVGVGIGICANKDKSSDSSNGSGEVSESASTSSLGSNSSHSKAPGAQLSSSAKHNGPSSLAPGYSLGRSTQEMLHANLLRKQLEIDKDPLLDSQEKAQRKQCLIQAYGLSSFYSSAVSAADTVESVVGNALDDLTLEDPLNLAASLDKDLVCGGVNDDRSSISAGLASSGIMLGSSAPVNIPGSSHVASAATNAHLFSSPGSSPNFFGGGGSTRFSHHECLTSSNFLSQSSASHHVSSAPKLGGLFDSFTAASPNHSNTSAYPMASGDVQMSRLAEAWRQEADESKRLASIAEKQRDEALAQATALQKEVDLLQGSPYLHALRRVSELSKLSYSTLESLRAQLLNDLQEVNKAIYLLQMRSECIVCKSNLHLSMSSCNHYVICNQCATNYRNECSYCNATSSSNQGGAGSGSTAGVVVTSSNVVGGSTTSATTAAK